MVERAIFDIVGGRRLNVGVMPEERIIAPFLLFFGLRDDPKLTPDEFSQGDTQASCMGLGAGPQVLRQQNRRAMHIHIIIVMDMAVKALG